MKARRKLEAVLSYAVRGTDIQPGSTLVVACSGGPDSTALLRALLAIQPTTQMRLHVAHLNHDFRGQEAEDDAEFVSAMAEDLGLPSTVDEADPMAYQRERAISSFEEAAREVRYRFLTNLANRLGAHSIALGHTADDQAETILMHLIRGAGLPGLRGMQELTTWRDGPNGRSALLFRPLLQASRHETRAYCVEQGIPFREDSTNRSPRFTRNRIRLQLMPTLGEYNPQVREALIRIGRAATEGVDYLEHELEGLWPEISSTDGESITLDRSRLNALHPALRGMVLRRAFVHVNGSIRRLSETHVKAMQGLAEATSGKSVNLPGGQVIRSTHDRLIIGPLEAPAGTHETPNYEYHLTIPGTTRIPGWLITAIPAPSDLEPKSLGCSEAIFDVDKIGKRLVVRNRRTGDYIQPLGMSGRKNLKNFFIDLKIPREIRSSTPLLVSEKGVLWVYPYRTSELARIDHTTRRRILVRWETAT